MVPAAKTGVSVSALNVPVELALLVAVRPLSVASVDTGVTVCVAVQAPHPASGR